MSEALDAAAALAYETYRTAHAGTVAGGLPMPVWEQLSVPERDAWLAVAGAVTVPPDPPELLTRWTQEDLEHRTVTELREMAQTDDVHVPSGATKHDIIAALVEHHAAQGGVMPDETTESGGPTLWTRETLAMRPEPDLREMASQAGVVLPEALTTQEVIDAVLEHQAEQGERP